MKFIYIEDNEKPKYYYSNGFYCYTCDCGKWQFSSQKQNFCPICGTKQKWPNDDDLGRLVHKDSYYD